MLPRMEEFRFVGARRLEAFPPLESSTFTERPVLQQGRKRFFSLSSVNTGVMAIAEAIYGE